MPPSPHKVGLVVDRNFGPRLAALAHAFHVWIVESTDNTPVIQEFWKSQQRQMVDDPLARGITSFVADEQESSEAACVRIACDVDEHHGEFAHEPPWSEIEVFGVRLTEGLRKIFEEIGASTFEPTQDGFICRRT